MGARICEVVYEIGLALVYTLRYSVFRSEEYKMSYGMVGYPGSLPAVCELCRHTVQQKMLPVVRDGKLDEHGACAECFAKYVTDEALFWQRNGRPMSTAEREEG